MTKVLDRIPVDKLIPDENNVRDSYPKVQLKELAESIDNNGQLEPIKVHPVGGDKFQIEYGHRRYYAIAMLNEDRKAGDKILVECVVEELDADDPKLEVLFRQIGENDQREDLNPMEEARSYQRVVDLGVSQSQLATRIGKNRSHVSKRLSLLRLPPAVQKLILEERLTIEVGVELAKLDDPMTDMGETMEEIKNGYNPTTDEIVDEVRVALERQQRRQAVVAFAEGVKAKGHPVVTFIESQKGVAAGNVVTSATEFTPSKIPAKLPAGAIGVEILGPERARILVERPKTEAAPATVDVSEDDKRAAASGDLKAQEKLAAKEKAAAQERRNLLARVREERSHRLGFLSTVAAKGKTADVGMLAMRFMVTDQITQYNRQRVCEILGLDPVIREEKVTEWKRGKEVETGKVHNVRDWEQALAAFLKDGGDRAVVKAAMACLSTRGETVLAERSPGFEVNHYDRWGYAEFIAPLGFEPLPEEQPLADPELFDELAPDPKPAKPAATKKAPAKKVTAKRL